MGIEQSRRNMKSKFKGCSVENEQNTQPAKFSRKKVQSASRSKGPNTFGEACEIFGIKPEIEEYTEEKDLNTDPQNKVLLINPWDRS